MRLHLAGLAMTLPILASLSASEPRFHTASYKRLLPYSMDCFSCMNLNFQKHWHNLKFFYYDQKNFTDDCIRMEKPWLIGTVPCKHSYCVTLFEPRFVAGYYMGNNVVRGCMNNILRNGGYSHLLTQVTQHMQEKTDSLCLTTKAEDLFNYPRGRTRRVAAGRPIQFCACSGHTCNDDVTQAAPPTKYANIICIYSLLLFLLFLC